MDPHLTGGVGQLIRQRNHIWLSFVVLFCLPAAVEAQTLRLVSGTIEYSVEVRTLGIKGHDIDATNRKCIGALLVRDDGTIDGGLIVPVSGFESDNSRRDRDVAKILEHKKHPAIIIEIADMTGTAIRSVFDTAKGEVPVSIRLTAAGVSTTYDTVIRFDWVSDRRVRCLTTIDATFSDFGITPPTLGLVFKRAPDAITLSGALLFERENGE